MDITYDPGADGASPGFVVDLSEERGRIVSIPVHAIGAYGSLLGYTDAVDCLEAICASRGASELTTNGENVWTEPEAISAHLEAVREAEANKAMSEGRERDPRSPELRGAMAVRAEMDSLSGEEACLLDRCRKACRDHLGLPDPDRTSTATRSVEMTCDLEPHSHGEHLFKACDREKVADVLNPLLAEISGCRERYRHSLTGNDSNPFDPLAGDGEPSVSDISGRYERKK